MKQKAQAGELWLARLDPQASLGRAERLAIVQAIAGVRQVRPREIIVSEGEVAEHAILVAGGLLARSKLSLDGRRQIVSILVPGDLANPDSGLLQRLDHSIVALSHGFIAQIPIHTLDQLPDVGDGLRIALRRAAAEDSAITREWVLNVGARSATARVAHLLCELSWRMQRVGLTRGSALDLPLMQQDLADATGISLVHANRVLQRLRQSAVLRFGASILDIVEYERLVAIAEFRPSYLETTRLAPANP